MLKSIWNRMCNLRCIAMSLLIHAETTENYEVTHEKKFWIHEILRRKNLGPTKYQQENILDRRNTHERKFGTHEIPKKARWHDGTRPTRPTIARKPRNLARSF